MSKTINISVYDLEQLEKENKSLKEMLEIKEKDYNDLVDENQNLEDELFAWKQMCKKLKAELEQYKKQYEHSMDEDLTEDF